MDTHLRLVYIIMNWENWPMLRPHLGKQMKLTRMLWSRDHTCLCCGHVKHGEPDYSAFSGQRHVGTSRGPRFGKCESGGQGRPWASARLALWSPQGCGTSLSLSPFPSQRQEHKPPSHAARVRDPVPHFSTAAATEQKPSTAEHQLNPYHVPNLCIY